MVIRTLLLGNMFQANCYVIENNSKEAVAIDIGGDSFEFMSFLKEKGLKLKKILLTHGHYDHFMGVAAVAEKTGAEVLIHHNDADKLTSAEKSLASLTTRGRFNKVNEYSTFSDGDTIDFSGIPIKVLHSPGHTAGCVSFVCENNIFTGDTLFRMSVGRTDFPGGDYSVLKNSLAKLKLLGREHDYNVYPGHESNTTLLFEIKNNPYMKE